MVEQIVTATGTAKLTLWEDNVDNDCYTLSGIRVWFFKGEKYLSIPKKGFTFTSTDDIRVVKEYNPIFILLSILRHTKVATLAMVKLFQLLQPQTQLLNAIVVNATTRQMLKPNNSKKLKLQTKQTANILHVSHHSSTISSDQVT